VQDEAVGLCEGDEIVFTSWIICCMLIDNSLILIDID